MSTSSNPYRGFRFPAEVISEAVWLYHCFSLSLHAVELILAAHGIEASCETIRMWSLRFGREFATTLKRRRPRPGDNWFLDEVFIRIRGKQHHLWRAVDQNGMVLDILVQSRRNKTAAKRVFRKLLTRLALSPARHRDGQAEILCGGEEGTNARGRAPTKPVSEQQLGSPPPADPTTRAAYEEVQLSPARPTVSFYPQPNPSSFPTAPSPPLCLRIRRCPDSRLHHVAQGGRPCAGRLIGTESRLFRPPPVHQQLATLTVPT